MSVVIFCVESLDGTKDVGRLVTLALDGYEPFIGIHQGEQVIAYQIGKNRKES